MNELLTQSMGALALAGTLAWGAGSWRAKVRSERKLRATMTPAEASGLIRSYVARQLAWENSHIEVSRVAYYDANGVLHAARHYEKFAGPETAESAAASREAKRLTDPRYALPAPLVPPAGFRPALLTRIPWSSVVGQVERLSDESHGRRPVA